MKASSSASATMAATMALSTNAAGPSRHSFSKMDSIAQSKPGVRSALGPLLERGVPRDVLTGIDLVAQPTPIGLRSESADLINLCEVLRAGGEEYIPRKPLFSPSRERKPQPRHSGRPPFRTRS